MLPLITALALVSLESAPSKKSSKADEEARVCPAAAVASEDEGTFWVGGRVACEMTKNVAFSNRTTSSASQILQNFSSRDSTTFTFGIRAYTIDDQALGKC